jgi:MFS transporter, DHA1 family, multidrug resistance protein
MVVIRGVITMSWSISTPFMPLFLIQIGVRPTPLVEIWAGAIASVSFLVAALVSPLWGSIADRHGRKRMVIRSCTAACISSALLGLCTAPWQLLIVQSVSGVFGGVSAASMALVATQVPEDLLGFALGWLLTGQTVGSLIGPFIGGILADRIHDFRAIFFVTAGGALIATVAAAALVQENFRPNRAAHERQRGSLWTQIREVARHPAIIPLLVVLLLAQVAALAPRPIIPLFVRSLLGDSAWLATAAGAAVAITGFADLIASPWLGKRSDRIGYRLVLLICLIGSALFTLPQGFAPNIWVLLALRFGVGVFLGGILPSANALVGKSFPRERRGAVYGLSSSATFLGMFLGPMMGGLIAARYGFPVMFLVMGALSAAAVVCVLWKTETIRTEPAASG